MVNRRHIRIKVMQSVYALLQSNSDDLTKEEKYLLFSINKIFDLYVLQLILLVEIKNMSLEHIEISKRKHLATNEDKDPNLKFIQNPIINSIEESPEIIAYVERKKLNNWRENREYVSILWKQLKNSKLFKNYLVSKETTFKEDKTFVLRLFEEIIAPNEKLYEYYDELNLGWVDDLPLINTLILKSIKQLQPNAYISLKEYTVRDDDRDFIIDLFRKTILHHTEYNDEINDKTPNWDTDRIAGIDLILIKMAITEFLYFPSIPTKVSINEYIEIAKDYSTIKSSYFINGVLDKILKDYNKSKRLNKIGRGLL
jgi:N utilization substance protein B